MKSWTKKIPKTEKCFWFKYTDKHRRRRITPAYISIFKGGWVICGIGVRFNSNELKYFGFYEIGPDIPLPKL